MQCLPKSGENLRTLSILRMDTHAKGIVPLILATLTEKHVQTHHQVHLDNINAQLQTLPQHMAILQEGITQSITIITTRINRWNHYTKTVRRN